MLISKGVEAESDHVTVFQFLLFVFSKFEPEVSLQHCFFVFLISLLHHHCLLDGFAAANLFAKLILIIILIFCHNHQQQQHPVMLLRLPA